MPARAQALLMHIAKLTRLRQLGEPRAGVIKALVVVAETCLRTEVRVQPARRDKLTIEIYKILIARASAFRFSGESPLQHLKWPNSCAGLAAHY